MKKRTKRDLTLLFGALLILAVMILVSELMTLGTNVKKFEEMRLALESKEMQKNGMLLQWDHMRKTKGKPKSGGKFSEELLAKDDDFVNIIGFMVPLEQFLDVTEFMLLPLPLECYFCAMPPARDVMLIKMTEGKLIERVIEEPVILNGKFTVNQGADQKFFYTLSDATLGAMEGVSQTAKKIKPEHMAPPSEHPGAKDGDDGLMAPSSAPRVAKPVEAGE